MEEFRKKKKDYCYVSLFALIVFTVFVVHWFLMIFGIPFLHDYAYGETISDRTIFLIICSIVYLLRFFFLLFYLLKRFTPLEEIFSVAILLSVVSFLYAYFNNRNLEIRLYDIPFMLGLVIGSFINTFSELQRKWFKDKIENEGLLYTRGLFTYARHVNYFGDIVLFFCWGYLTGNIFVAIVVPVGMFLGFQIQHVPGIEKYLQEKYESQFVLYKESTPNMLIPLVPIDQDPVDFMSDCYVATQMSGHEVHLDMGSTEENYGIPYHITTSSDQLSTIGYGTGCNQYVYDDYSSESDPGPFRIPQNAHIEGGTTASPDPTSGDRHLLAINLDTCMLYETYMTYRVSGGFCCASSALWNLTKKNNKRPDGWTSADAAGLPIFPALIKYDEAHNSSIKHALRFTLPDAPRAYVYPGGHYGGNENMNYPPYGTRFRLKASFDISVYTGEAYAIAFALKKYGMYFADQGSAMYVTGTSHPNFGDAINQIHSQHPIDGSNFEAVQSPFTINYGWSVTPSCNLRYQNVNPYWRPRTLDLSLCGIPYVPDSTFWRDFAIIASITSSLVLCCLFIVILFVAVSIIVTFVLWKPKKEK